MDNPNNLHVIENKRFGKQEPNPELIKTMETALTQAKEGIFTSIFCVALGPNGEAYRLSSVDGKDYMAMLGALHFVTAEHYRECRE